MGFTDSKDGLAHGILALLVGCAALVPNLGWGAFAPVQWASFTNLNFTQVDPHGAAGPQGILVAANPGIAYHTKAGTRLWQTNEQAFFIPTVCCDAKALYDPDSQRFFVIAQESVPQILVGTNLVNQVATNVFVNVSRSSNPQSGGTNDWRRYKFSIGNAAWPATFGIDYPGIGIDGQALYVTYGKQHKLWMAINKSNLLSGVTNGTTARVVTNLLGGLFIPNFALQAVSVMGSASPGDVAYAVSTDQNTNGVLLYAITNVLGVHSYFATNLPGPNAGRPTGLLTNLTLAAQFGVTNRLIPAANVAMGNAFWREGELWFCAAVYDTNQQERTLIRYYKLKTGGFPNGQVTLDEWGDLDGGPNTWRQHPAISGNARGDVCILYTQTSSNAFNRMYASIRKAGQTNFDTVLIKTSTAAWTQSINWADYAVVTPDPEDQTFWVSHLTIRATNIVDMWWANITRDSLFYVDKNAVGPEVGIREFPWHSVRLAHTVATGAKTLVIKPASYPEPTLPLRLDKNVRLENPYPSGTVHIGP